MSFYKSIRKRVVMWIWNHTPTCTDMSRLASQSLEQPRSLKTRLKMRLHFLICAWCKRYFEQLNFVHRAAPDLHDHATNSLAGSLSADARQRIMERLRSPENK